MDPVVTLTEKDLVVDPGGDTVTEVSIRNRSEIVEEFEVVVVGEAAPYAQAIPPTISVYPGDVATAEIQLRPPFDTAVSTGKQPFGVFVRSKDDPECSAVAEGQLTVGSINLLDVRVLPSRSRGRWRAKHSVELHNEGTEQLRVRLGTVDAEQKLSFGLAPRELDIKPGSASEAFLKVRPQKPKIFGQPIVHPFEVSYRRKADKASALLGASAGGEVEATVPGTFEQRAIIAKWMIVVAVLAILIAVLVVFRLRNNDPDIPPQTSIDAPGAPTGVVVTSGRIDSEAPFGISWEPSSGSPGADRYIVQFIDTDDLEAVTGYTTLFTEVIEAPATAVTNFEQLIAARPELVDGSSAVDVCVLVQAEADVGTPETAATTRSVLVGGEGAGQRSDLPAPACGTHFGNDCNQPTITEAFADPEIGNQIQVMVDYDEVNCTDVEGAVLLVLVNGQSAGPEGAQRVRSFTVNVAEIEPEDGGYRITVQFAGDISDPATVTRQDIDGAIAALDAEQLADEVAQAEEEAAQAQADADAEAEANATPTPEPDPNLIQPQGIYAVVLAVSQTGAFRYTGPGDPASSADEAVISVFGAARSIAIDQGFDPGRVRGGLSPAKREDLPYEATAGIDNTIALAAGTFGVGQDFLVIVDGFATETEVNVYCMALQVILDNAGFPWPDDYKLEIGSTFPCTPVVL